MIIISFLIYFILALLISISVYGRLFFSKFVQILLITLFGINILIYIGLNLFKAIDHAFLFLVLQILICSLIFLGLRWRRPITFKEFLNKSRFSTKDFGWFDYTLLGLIGLILAAFFVVGISTPPNNLDSLDPTHLTKLFYWIQQGTFSTVATTSLGELFDPIFIHIQGLWLFSLGRSETLFFLVQWFSLLTAAFTVFGISRSLKFSITNSLLSTLVSLSLPVVLLQTYSFQGDLTVAVFVLVCISFGLDWLITKSRIELVAALIAFIFALGSKRAAFLAIPVFGLFFLFWLISRIKKKKIIPWLTVSVVVVLVAAVSLVGQVVFRQGGVVAGVQLINGSQLSTDEIIGKVKYNTPRFLYQFMGVDGLPRVIQNSLYPIKADLFQWVFIPSSLDLQKEVFLQPGYDDVEKFSYSAPLILSEEGAWFGPIGFILIPLAVILAFFSRQKQRRLYAIFTLVLFLSFFIMVVIQRPGWDPYQGRYFILPVLPLIPLVSMVIPSQKIWRAFLIVVILPVCLVLSFNTFFANNSRPVITAGSIWGFQYQRILTMPENNKLERYFKSKLTTSFDKIASAALDRPTIYQVSYWNQVYYSGFRLLGNIEFIDPLVPNGATLYLDLPSTALDYGLFGKEKDRTLMRVDDVSKVTSGYFITKSTSQIVLTKDMKLLGDNGTYKVYLIHSK